MGPNGEKEVDFETYCPKCRYSAKLETEDPCNDCLEQPYNIYTTKPIEYKDATLKRRNTS